MPGTIAPRPPARLTIRGEALKSLPSPPSMLVSAKEPQGVRKSSKVISTSRRRKSKRISRLNWAKLSPANRLSGPGAGIKRKMVVVQDRDDRQHRRQRSKECRIPAPAETYIEHRSKYDRPEIRRQCRRR